VVVLAANKGLCGSFNADLLNFARTELFKLDRPYRLVACGKQAISFFKEKRIPIDHELVFDDVPTYEDGGTLLNLLTDWRAEKKISAIKVIYPHYFNMVKQKPCVETLFEAEEFGKKKSGENILFVPDRPTIIEKTANNIFRSLMYEVVLETALGAQAATLMTMFSQKMKVELLQQLYEALKQLNALIIPAFEQGLKDFIAECRKNDLCGVAEIPLLFEKGYQDLFDTVLCVWSPVEVRKKRLAAYRNFSAEEFESREQHQLSADKKLEQADFAVINCGEANELYRQLDELLRFWQKQ
jgi:dephospho-CoA kinase